MFKVSFYNLNEKLPQHKEHILYVLTYDLLCFYNGVFEFHWINKEDDTLTACYNGESEEEMKDWTLGYIVDGIMYNPLGVYWTSYDADAFEFIDHPLETTEQSLIKEHM